MQGVCMQNHFPAVAQPFRVLWAPWSLAVLGIVSALTIGVFVMLLLGAAVGGIALFIMLPGFHAMAVIFGLKLRYLSSMVLSLDNRKTGSTNLSQERGSFEFANI